jgi:hypothetical protein
MANTLIPINVVALTNTLQTVHTVGTSNVFTVAMLHISNYTGNQINITAHLIPSGASATDANTVLSGFPVDANDVVELFKGDIWSGGSVFQMKANTNSAGTVKLAGVLTN